MIHEFVVHGINIEYDWLPFNDVYSGTSVEVDLSKLRNRCNRHSLEAREKTKGNKEKRVCARSLTSVLV